MDIALWVVSGILAAAYLAAGIMKSTRPLEKLQPTLPWVDDFTVTQVRLIGVAEILGALGLILPWLTGIAPILTPIAALGLVIVQVGAIVVHVRRKETQVLPVNVVLLIAAGFIAVGRFLQL